MHTGKYIHIHAHTDMLCKESCLFHHFTCSQVFLLPGIAHRDKGKLKDIQENLSNVVWTQTESEGVKRGGYGLYVHVSGSAMKPMVLPSTDPLVHMELACRWISTCPDRQFHVSEALHSEWHSPDWLQGPAWLSVGSLHMTTVKRKFGWCLILRGCTTTLLYSRHTGFPARMLEQREISPVWADELAQQSSHLSSAWAPRRLFLRLPAARTGTVPDKRALHS